MAISIGRRNLIAVLGGAAVGWPRSLRAQPIAPVIGYLSHGSPETSALLVAAFRKGLSEMGYVEGQNLGIEYRWANFQMNRLPDMAADLVRRNVRVIATPVSTPASHAAKAATATIPIVFAVGTDPVKAGLVASFNRPGGNITGIVGLNWELGPKRLGLLHELVPNGNRFAALVNQDTPETELFLKAVQEVAGHNGWQLESFSASSNQQIDQAFASLSQRKGDALLVASDQFFLARRVQIVGLCIKHSVPALFAWREAVEAGGLVSYGSSFADLYRQAGVYSGRILKGEKPGELPVIQASKFELLINLQTAKTQGLSVPPTLLASADEVIE
jgi:putative ABC transport system substrate-binding protein